LLDFGRQRIWRPSRKLVFDQSSTKLLIVVLLRGGVRQTVPRLRKLIQYPLPCFKMLAGANMPHRIRFRVNRAANQIEIAFVAR
jgi:hypothetical protein